MPPVSGSLDVETVRRILRRMDVVPEPDELSAGSLTAVGDGVNDVLVVDAPSGEFERFVLKVGTFSRSEHLRAGVAAARALRAYTTLPVPAVLAFDPGSDDRPPAVASAYCDGTPLAAGFDDVPNLTDPARVSLLGAVVREFAAIPPDAATGYGNVVREAGTEDRPRLVGETAGFDEWLHAYASKHFESPAPHPALERVAPDALAFLDANRRRIPAEPTPSVLVTDLSPGNLLAPAGEPPATVDGLAGVVDLERAKVGPVAFTATNLEYLLTADVDDPPPVRRALYDQLPFDHDHALRDVYRLAAVSRAVSGLDTWEDPEGDRFDRRARAVAREVERIVD